MTLEHTEQLRALLQRRLDIIADHDLRSRAPEEQFKALQTVSNDLQTWHQQHRSILSARLNHFMTQASFSKALEYIDRPEA
jgi:hypothetical protein